MLHRYTQWLAVAVGLLLLVATAIFAWLRNA
jgi:hypothetical protein